MCGIQHLSSYLKHMSNKCPFEAKSLVSFRIIRSKFSKMTAVGTAIDIEVTIVLIFSCTNWAIEHANCQLQAQHEFIVSIKSNHPHAHFYMISVEFNNTKEIVQ